MLEKGIGVETDLRCDLFIEGILPVELKAVETVLPVHEAQLLTYMQLLNAPIGLLLNFNSMNLFRHGQKTFVNDIYRTLWD
jgi:GxxExxY protein